MNCIKTEPLLAAYLAEELDAGRAAAVSEHLQACTACHAALAEAQAFAAYLREIDDCWGDAPGLAVPRVLLTAC